MRTLSATLTAAQIAHSGSPYIYLNIADTDLSSRLLSISQTEYIFGGGLGIRLSNHDKAYSNVDVRGYRVYLGFGFTTGEGNEYSLCQPYYVWNERLISEQGFDVAELDCIDSWQLLQMLKVISEDMSAVPGWGGDTAIVDIIEDILAYTDIGLDVDSYDDYMYGYNPVYAADSINYPLSHIIIDMLNMTGCSCRIENDGDLHVMTLSPGDPDYSYNNNAGDYHHFFLYEYEEEGIVPNRVFVVDEFPDLNAPSRFFGYADNSASQSMWSHGDFNGIFGEVFKDPTIESDDDAEDKADALIARIEGSKTKGRLVAPMNCGQELLDYVSVTDPRTGRSDSAFIGGITRTWSPGVYRIELALGGLQYGYTFDKIRPKTEITEEFFEKPPISADLTMRHLGVIESVPTGGYDVAEIATLGAATGAAPPQFAAAAGGQAVGNWMLGSKGGTSFMGKRIPETTSRYAATYYQEENAIRFWAGDIMGQKYELKIGESPEEAFQRIIKELGGTIPGLQPGEHLEMKFGDL